MMCLRRAFGLTRYEAALVRVLLDGEPATRERLLSALIEIDGRRARDFGGVRVLLHYARHKLAAHGIKVQRGNRAVGASLSPDDIQRIRAAGLTEAA